ncbi:DUF937 domain-containing protein [Enterovirga sp.]|jgi:hypothetical protein|uniref:DUF937 domain-containing protein n=1 Tax=Enterovirga sp. TaxID=2026350 RepID=UPI0026326EF1|nr:DUF937 domain-containing protein [Enterovirga sp.]MDB5592612.1 hypothetical protein [Enterovirga sp.]
MVNLFDIMRQAQHGAALDQLSRQFGLNSNETQRALEALLPAFSLAFRRNAQDPASFAGLLDLMLSGRYLPSFDGTSAPRAGAGDLLARLFGSGDVAQRVADQAAGTTGIAVGVLQQMMPVVAATLVGGMSRTASVEGFADMLRQWSDALKSAAPKRPAPQPASGDPWAAWHGMIETMTGRPPQPQPAPSAAPFEAWSRLMSTMLGGQAEAPKPPPPAPVPNPFQAVAQMFETGREIQDRNVAAFQAILDGQSAGPTRAG